VRIVGYIVGGLIILFGLTPLLLGIGIVGYVRDLEPLEIPLNGFQAPPEAVAVVSPEFSIDAADIPSELRNARLILQVEPAADSGPLFIGLAPAKDLQRYLRNAPIATLEPVDEALPIDQGSGDGASSGSEAGPDPQVVLRGVQDGVDVDLVLEPGGRKKVPAPATRRFWTKTVEVDADGRIEVSLADLQGEAVRVVVLRQDGRPGIAADASIRFKLPIVMTAGWALLVVGLVSVGIGALMIVLIAVRDRPKPGGPAPGAPAPTAGGPPPPAGPAPAVDTGPPSGP
jgi:hypothetical protein